MEALQKMSDDRLKDCPECNNPTLTKLISAASFRLKGSGWYETDFKTGDKKQLAESDSAKSASSSENSTPSVDATAKPEATPKPAAGKKDAPSKAKSAKSSAKKSN